MAWGVLHSEEPSYAANQQVQHNLYQNKEERIEMSDIEMSIHRLGKHDPGKVRPTKVTLSTEELAMKEKKMFS